MFRFGIFIFLFLIQAFQLHAEEPAPDLVRDLCIIEYWNKKLNDRLPVYYNTSGYVGYYNMPSARMAKDGTFAFGFNWVPPYINWTIDFQLLDRFEVSGAYRIFRGVQDANLSPLGFGDYADKGINAKVCLLKPEDTGYTLPGISIGADDFLGSQMFASRYVVFTKVYPDANLEWSLGWCWGRMRHLFGAFAWTPWRQCSNSWINGLTLCAEYDNTDYEDPNIEPHPKGRIVHSRINAGLKYHFLRYLDLSVSSLRGVTTASSLAFTYPIGSSKGLIAKVDDPLYHKRPVNREPISQNRPELDLCNDIAYALKEQGFTLLEASIEFDEESQRIIRLKVSNDQWRYERILHKRLSWVLATLIPTNVDKIVVDLICQGLPCQEYKFRREDLIAFSKGCIGSMELDVLSAMSEVTCNPCSQELFSSKQKLINWGINPRIRTFFGSAKGKFKYSVGTSLDAHGFVFGDIFYKFQVGYTVFSSMSDVSDMDKLNPSQILNVHSDWINYHRPYHFTFEHAYMQKAWNLTKGFFGRLGGGFFESAYAGSVAEVLYYPVNSPWAFGAEYALLKKRSYSGFGFQNTIRILDGYTPTYVPYNYLSQYFFDIYYDFSLCNVELKLSIGQFLARDKGARIEMTRYFKNGLRILVWYTLTNGHDYVNGSVYYDKGIGFSVPLDFFMKKSSTKRLGYSMSAWLRDVGFRSGTGNRLFQIVNEERR
ncbi:MAG: YjbH domain-containing protein [Parachlamydiales bacterium]|nr:YjbH domain-containing protein [Parachlamydiales bacterium]